MDNDLYNHVNNATYYSFIDTAVTSYLANAVDRDLANDPVAYLVVENGCSYFSPIAFPDAVHCGLRVTHIGTSSMRFEVGHLPQRRGARPRRTATSCRSAATARRSGRSRCRRACARRSKRSA